MQSAFDNRTNFLRQSGYRFHSVGPQGQQIYTHANGTSVQFFGANTLTHDQQIRARARFFDARRTAAAQKFAANLYQNHPILGKHGA